MPRTSIFIFEISTDGKNLEKEIFDTFQKMKVDTSKKLPWEGFVTKKENGDLVYEKDEQETNRLTYVLEYEEDYTSVNGKTFKNRKIKWVPIWIDNSTKLMMIFTSDAGIAFKIIQKIAQQKDHTIIITPLKLDIEFMKWLENIKDFQKSKIIKIIGTRATNLEDTDGASNNLSLTTTGVLNKSQLFLPIKDKGSRVYVKGVFQINDAKIECAAYTNCKLSLSKKKASNMSMDEVKHSAKTIYQELKNLNQKWKNK
jgi:hypothetical protein